MRARSSFVSELGAWDALLLQEAFRNQVEDFELDGHLVIVSNPPQVRGRTRLPLAIAIHSSLKHNAILPTRMQSGMSLGIALKTQDEILFLISALLDPYSLPSDYEDSINDFNNLIRAAPVNSMPNVGVDAQSPLPRSPAAAESPIGDHASHESAMIGAWKTSFLLRAVMEWGLPVANTILEPSDGSFTFPVHGRFPPSQIDFILVHPRLLHGARCGPFYFE